MIVFDVLGQAASQGSHRAFVSASTGRAIVTQHNAPKHRDWRSAVAGAAHDAMAGRLPLDEPLFLDVVFRLPPPKKPRWPQPAVRPDADKLLRAVMDALTAIVWADDARVIHITAAKEYATPAHPPGARITVRTLSEYDAELAGLFAYFDRLLTEAGR